MSIARWSRARFGMGRNSVGIGMAFLCVCAGGVVSSFLVPFWLRGWGQGASGVRTRRDVGVEGHLLATQQAHSPLFPASLRNIRNTRNVFVFLLVRG